MSEPRMLAANYVEAVISEMENGKAVHNRAQPLADHIAALEARIAELEPRAELGRLVEAMPIQTGIIRLAEAEWVNRSFDYDDWDHIDYPTPADALRALVGEKDG